MKVVYKNHLARKETLAIKLLDKQHVHSAVEFISVRHLSVPHMDPVHS